MKINVFTLIAVLSTHTICCDLLNAQPLGTEDKYRRALQGNIADPDIALDRFIVSIEIGDSIKLANCLVESLLNDSCFYHLCGYLGSKVDTSEMMEVGIAYFAYNSMRDTLVFYLEKHRALQGMQLTRVGKLDNGITTYKEPKLIPLYDKNFYYENIKQPLSQKNYKKLLSMTLFGDLFSNLVGDEISDIEPVSTNIGIFKGIRFYQERDTIELSVELMEFPMMTKDGNLKMRSGWLIQNICYVNVQSKGVPQKLGWSQISTNIIDGSDHGDKIDNWKYPVPHRSAGTITSTPLHQTSSITPLSLNMIRIGYHSSERYLTFAFDFNTRIMTNLQVFDLTYEQCCDMFASLQNHEEFKYLKILIEDMPLLSDVDIKVYDFFPMEYHIVNGALYVAVKSNSKLRFETGKLKNDTCLYLNAKM